MSYVYCGEFDSNQLTDPAACGAVMIRNSCPFNFSKNAIEERIKAIMATKKVTRLSMLVSFVNYPQADRKFQHKKRPDCYIKPLLLGYFCFMSK